MLLLSVAVGLQGTVGRPVNSEVARNRGTDCRWDGVPLRSRQARMSCGLLAHNCCHPWMCRATESDALHSAPMLVSIVIVLH